MYLITIFEGKDVENCTPVRVVLPSTFNIELKEKFINIFDEENRRYQTEHFDKADIRSENKVIILYRFTKE